MADPVDNPTPSPAPAPYELPPVDVTGTDSPPAEATPPPAPPEPPPPAPRTHWFPSGILAEPNVNVRHLSLVPSIGLGLTTIPLEYFKNRLLTQGLVLDDALTRGEVPSGQAGSARSLVTIDRAVGQTLGAVEGLTFYYGIRYSKEDWVAYPMAALGLGMGIYRLATPGTPDGVRSPDDKGYKDAQLPSALYPMLGAVNGTLARIGDSTNSRWPGIVGSFASFGTGMYLGINNQRSGIDRDTGTITMALAGSNLTLQPNPWIAATGALSQLGMGTYLVFDGSPVHGAALMQTALSLSELRVDSNWSYFFDGAGLALGTVQLARGETAAGLIHGIPSLLFGTVRLLSTLPGSKEDQEARNARRKKVADVTRHFSIGTIKGPSSVGTGLVFSGELP